MRPTRRGLAALAIATVAVVLAGAHGPRALNAVAAPLFGAVAFGAIQVWRADDPEIDCHPVEPGFPGSTRRYRVDLSSGGLLAVGHTWPDGIEGDPIDGVVAGSATVEAEITLRDRGRYEISPPTLRRRDALGLVRAPYETAETTTIVVYPDIHRDASPEAFAGILGTNVLAERQEFDRLREYIPGDPLRDVHWKSSAKGDDFFVAEYEPSDRAETITVAASAEPGTVDAMATAAGTIAVLALESGLSVGLSLPDRAIPPATGRDHASTILAALAAATHGSIEGTDAEISIHATPAETRVTVEETTYRFEDITEENSGLGGTEVVAT